jgi:hypothetical protein
MPDLHVEPDTRKATWLVRLGRQPRPQSVHASATEAELAARRQAEERDVDRIIIRDRYARTRQLIRRGYAWRQRSG